MAKDRVQVAPAWRRLGAIAIDVGFGVAIRSALRRRRGLSVGLHDALARSESPWVTLIEPTSDLVREQLGSPGQRLLGIRTVEERTGKRLPLWKSLVMAAARLAMAKAAGRTTNAAMSPERVAERERHTRALREIAQRHADDPDAFEAARRGLGTQDAARVDLRPTLVLGLLSTLLRRRLARTAEVAARARA